MCLPRKYTNRINDPVLDAFAKLRNVTVSFVMSVCPSVRPSSYPHGTQLRLDGYALDLISIFQKCL